MAINDETIKLVLDLVKSSGSQSVVDLLEQVRAATTKTAEAYDVLTGELGTYGVVQQKVTQDVKSYTPALDAQVAKAVEATRTQKLLRESLEATTVAQEQASRSSREMSMRILNLGRAAQDLAQGGFAGIVNNIEGIVGGGGMAAGILTAIGTAAFLATPYIKEWVGQVGLAKQAIPQTTDVLERYSESINKNKEELKALKEQQELTFFELRRYNQLLDETAKLEEEQANAREARSIKDGSSKKDRANASAFRETISERYGSSQELIDAIMATERGQQLGLKRVEEMIAGGMRGNGLEIQNLRNINPQFNERFTPFSPEAQEQFRKAQENFKKEQAFQAQRERSIAEKNRAAEQLADDIAAQQQKDAKAAEQQKAKADRGQEAAKRQQDRLRQIEMKRGDEALLQRDAQRKILQMGGGQGNAQQDLLIAQMLANQGAIGQNELQVARRMIQAQETFRKLQEANNVMAGVQ